MWIKLLAIKQIDVHGVKHTRHPGDWVDIGKQTARRWIAASEAEVPSMKKAGLIEDDAGAVVRGDVVMGSLLLAKYAEGMTVVEAEHELAIPFARTLFFKSPAPVRPELFPIGFHLLETWEVVVPLWNYDVLACHVGTDEERKRTEAIIHDLRVLLYDTRLMFMRDCGNAKRLLKTWMLEKQSGDDERLAFLRALYQVKPFVLALPTTWLGTGPR